MRELEAKILEIDRQQVESDLVKLGATKVFDGNVESHYYDYPGDRLAKHKAELRLLKAGEEITITYKQKRNDGPFKDMNEVETAVGNFQEMNSILLMLGLEERAIIKKQRASYKLDDVKFEIDTIDGLPTFLEIEGPNDNIIKSYATKLGFNPKDLLSWKGSDVIAHYQS